MNIDQVRMEWDRLAPAWESGRDDIYRSTRQVSEWLLRAIDPQPRQTILELASGTGETGFMAAKLVGGDGRVIITDISPAMVEAASRRADELGLANVELRVMDAGDLQLPDDSVDAILCKFGYMFVADPASAFASARRALRPGSRLAFASWGDPADNPWIAIGGICALKRGVLEQSDQFAPGGMFSLSDPTSVRDLLLHAGFANVDIEEITVAFAFDSYEEVWQFYSKLAGSLALSLQEADQVAVELVRKDLEESLAPLRNEDDGSIELAGKALGVLAY